MTPELLDENEAKQIIKAYVESRNYWIVPWVTPEAARFSEAFEQRFYSGRKNRDFNLMMGRFLPGGVMAFGHKKHVTAQQICDFVGEKTGIDLPPSEDASRDFLIIVPPEETPQIVEIVMLMDSFDHWLHS